MSKSYHQVKALAAGTQATSTAVQFDSTVTTGRSIVVFVRGNHVSGYGLTSVTDSESNSYSQVIDTGIFGSDNRDRAYCYVAHNVTGGSAITVTANHTQTTGNGVCLVIVEFSATGTISTDKTGNATDPYPVSTTSGPTASLSATTDDSTAIVFGFSSWGNAAATISGTINSSGYTTPVTAIDATAYRRNGCFSYKILSSSEQSTYQVTLDSIDTNQNTMVVAFKETASTTKKLKVLTHASAASASSVAGVVFSAPTGGAITGTTRYGEFTNKTFEATLESGKAVLKVPVADFGGSALTTSDSPVALVRNTTKTTGIITCTVIEE